MEVLGYWLIGCVVGVSLIWRLWSRRQSLPCPVWLRWMVELDNPFTKTNRADFIIAHLGVDSGMSVLDAGCGPGRLTLKLAQVVGTAGRVTALDIQQGMLDRVHGKADAAGVRNIDYLQAGLGEGRLPENAYDRAVLVTVLGEIPAQEPALRELFAALKPGGLLSITEVIFDPHFQTRATVTRLARAAGFEEVTFLGHRLAYVMHWRKPAA